MAKCLKSDLRSETSFRSGKLDVFALESVWKEGDENAFCDRFLIKHSDRAWKFSSR